MRNPVNITSKYSRERGVTLVELVISMLVITIAIGGIMAVINFTTIHSADPLLRHQAVAVAEAYMEEITLKAYTNPSGGYSGSDRSRFDDVGDYNLLHDVGVRNQFGSPVAILHDYTVDVLITDVTMNGVAAKKIYVRVQRGQDVDLTLTGYRTDYE